MHTWATQPECQRLEGQSRGPKSLQGEAYALVLLVFFGAPPPPKKKKNVIHTSYEVVLSYVCLIVETAA